MGKIRKKRKPSKKYSFRLSYIQSQSLQNYCALHQLSPNKLIKSLLKEPMTDFTDAKLGKEYRDKMQLSLFEERPIEYTQMQIFDE